MGLTGAAPAPPVFCFDERYPSVWQETSTIERFESFVHVLTFLFVTRADRERFWLISIGWLDAPTFNGIVHRERRRKGLFRLTTLRVLSYGINLTDLGAWKMTTKVGDCWRKSVCWRSIKQSTATLSFYQINRSINSEYGDTQLGYIDVFNDNFFGNFWRSYSLYHLHRGHWVWLVSFSLSSISHVPI